MIGTVQSICGGMYFISLCHCIFHGLKRSHYTDYDVLAVSLLQGTIIIACLEAFIQFDL